MRAGGRRAAGPERPLRRQDEPASRRRPAAPAEGRRRRAAGPEGPLRRLDELELKYALDDPRAVARWLDEHFPPTADEAWQTVRLTDRYFDTADGALASAGYGARLRRQRRRTTLGLKSGVAHSGALHHRREIEAPARDSLHVASWPPSAARDLVLAIAGDAPLVERFVLIQTRRERDVRAGGAVVALSVDRVRVSVAGRPCGELVQLEVELRVGQRSALRRLARSIEGSGLVTAEPRNKMEIAAALAADAARMTAEDTLVEAGRKVLRGHLLRLLEREPLARAGDEPALKQMRVAMRRLRATWRVFGAGFRQSVVRRHVAALRRAARALGEVRDLDVLVGGLPDDVALAPLADEWRERRADAFAAALRLLDSPRYRRFLDDALTLTGTHGAGAARRRAAAAAVADEAPEKVRESHERLLRAGAAAIGTDDDAAWHGLRIGAKRMRYTLEAFRPLLAEAPAKALIERLTRVQDHLGAMNDAAVAADEAERLLAGAAQRLAPEEGAAITAFAADRRRFVARARRSFAPAWRGVAGVTFDRMLRRALLTER